MSFEYKIIEEQGLLKIELSGKMIEETSTSDFVEKVKTMISPTKNIVLLNFKNLSYINSTGINVLINLLTKARNAGGELAICNINESIKKLLIISKLNTIFNSFDSEKEALESLLKTNKTWQ